MSTNEDEFADIDYTTKEVFETSDNEDENDYSPLSPSHSRRSSIEVLENTPSEAREAFERVVIDGADANFSGKILDPTHKSYLSYSLSETYEQRLVRIKKELHEMNVLKHERDLIKDDNNEIESLLASIDQNVSLSLTPKKVEGDLLNVKKIEKEKLSQPDTDIPVATIMELDSRVSQLEKSMGFSDSLEKHDNFTVQSLINDLYRKLNIISNPEYVKSDVRPLLEMIAKQNTTRKKDLFSHDVLSSSSSIDDRKFSLVHQKLLSLPNFESYLPLLLNKLKSLNKLNVELSKGVEKLEDYQNRLFTIESSFLDWQNYLNKYETRLTEMESKSEANKIEIENWIKKLQEKVDTLAH